MSEYIRADWANVGEVMTPKIQLPICRVIFLNMILSYSVRGSRNVKRRIADIMSKVHLPNLALQLSPISPAKFSLLLLLLGN